MYLFWLLGKKFTISDEKNAQKCQKLLIKILIIKITQYIGSGNHDYAHLHLFLVGFITFRVCFLT